MAGVQAAAFRLVQRHGLSRGVLGQVMAGGALGGDDGLAAGNREILVGGDGHDRDIRPAVTALEFEQVAGDIDGVLLHHRGLRHTSVGPHLKRVDDEAREAIEAILRLQVAEADAAMRELGSLREPVGRDEPFARRMARDAAQRIEEFASTGAVHVHDLRRALGGGLRLQRGEVMLDRDKALVVRLGEDLRHDRARVDGGRIGDELAQPFRADALGDGRERRTAHGGQTGRATVAVHATELVIQQTATFGRRLSRMETLEARDERFGAQRGGAEQDRKA